MSFRQHKFINQSRRKLNNLFKLTNFLFSFKSKKVKVYKVLTY